MVIGRADPNKGITPDIDLGPEGGFDAGVSRRHAVLAHSSGAYTVEDLGSANGTYVNGRRLTPQAVVPIRSGDELRCGTLVLRIEIG
jgi:pSer/pThr/pTyr-binding forkhead associated (FHA) protein